MYLFTARIEIIGVNPYVFVPEKILQSLFDEFGKDKGQIPIKVTIAGKEFIQTLVRYSGEWRLYLNVPMRDISHTKVGDNIDILVAFDPLERKTPMHPKLRKAFEKEAEAKAIFDKMSPSHQKEIMRYINNLKSDESVDRNVINAINYLHGEQRFIGREKPKK